VTVLQERPKSRPLLATFLVGWLVAALSYLVAGRLFTSEDSWLPWALGVPLMPALPVILAAASWESEPVWVGMVASAVALVPLAVYLLGRRANRRRRLVLCLVIAAWWLGYAAFGWWFVQSGPHM
jgi:hypothetical protein